MENQSSSAMDKVIGVFDDMRYAGIIEKYAVGGAFAAVLHNEPILSLTAIYDYAKARGFLFDHEFVNIHGWLVQFIEASHSRLWTEAIEDADTMKIDDLNFSVIGKEHLVAMWLFAGRAKDYQKIAMFREADFLDETRLFDILERHDLMRKWNKEKWRFFDEE